ncbi:hypothetical protein MSAN_01041700 [Mycena sanguinolenta]|uniref:CxC1-like cysteine cluster associated with KDZ transposases domain-containing protein n=1 Tax=Mycena sanguinolenta TaxID=230812 RepID=A0A8H7D8W9_9AGAR|nr:hypothetical protein MSAN_01041700 [Mycena sanguinolenta]
MAQMIAEQQEALAAEQERREVLTAQELVAEEAWRDEPDDFIGPTITYEREVLDGTRPADISHAGEAIDPEAADEELLEDLAQEHDYNAIFSKKARRPDYRRRRDRTRRLVDAFSAQLGALTDAYMDWSASTGLAASYAPAEEEEIADRIKHVSYTMSPYERQTHSSPLASSDKGCSLALPRWPQWRSRRARWRFFALPSYVAPRLGIQAWVRMMCDIHGVPPRPYLGVQFSVAFDVYLLVREETARRVRVALGRNDPCWRLRNVCPCCTYKLEGERKDWPFLFTCDGNDSAKRFARKTKEQWDDEGNPLPRESAERDDSRRPPGDYFIPRDVVDSWAVEDEEELAKVHDEDEEKDSGCAEKWQNMKEVHTVRAAAVYDETGIFAGLCRHGFVLALVDMVKSGELAKYAFALLAHLCKALGPEIAKLILGYDIGCRFYKMVMRHPRVSDLLQDRENLPKYKDDVGLEGFEGCETFFSESNALAARTRYSTAFHRWQAFVTWAEHKDRFQTYGQLSVIAEAPVLARLTSELNGATSATLEGWLKAEREYLSSLKKEPEEETLQMEYYQALVNFYDAKEAADGLRSNVTGLQFVEESGADRAGAESTTRRFETNRRHVCERENKCLEAVRYLEARLEVVERWQPGDENWIQAQVLVSKRRYQLALDKLESLVAARLLELWKMNIPGTGYKLRKHIAKAMQARSKAVRTALANYNAAAAALKSPRPPLEWEAVVEYAFLAEFDLLRFSRRDVRSEPWAQGSGRAAVDLHFKIKRAKEEVERLNVEIRRLYTYMRDEDAFLAHHARRLRDNHQPQLAYQVEVHRQQHIRFNDEHRRRLEKLRKETGCTAVLEPGTALSKDREVPRLAAAEEEMPDAARAEALRAAESEVEGVEDVDAEAVADSLELVLRIADDVAGDL